MSSLLGNLKECAHTHIISISSTRRFYKSYSTLTVIYRKDFNSCSAEAVSPDLLSEIKRCICDHSNIRDLVFRRCNLRERKLIFSYDHSVSYLKKYEGYLQL